MGVRAAAPWHGKWIDWRRSSPVRQGSVEFVKELARSLSIFDPVIDVLQALADGKRLKARILTARRGGRVMLKEAYTAEGVMGVVRFISASYHDVSHVLNGYRTDPDGEIQQGSFQGG